jgi:hypothetical protein
VNEDLLDLDAIESADEAVLERALLVIRAELLRRSVEAADPAALVDEAFRIGFHSSGLPKDPWVRSGVLVAPGAKIDRSAMAHKCAFVRVGNLWVWEHPDILEDSVRYLPGAQQRMQSVSLIPLAEGDSVDLVEARTRNGVHELVGVRSFTLEDGVLQLVATRSVGKVSHR